MSNARLSLGKLGLVVLLLVLALAFWFVKPTPQEQRAITTTDTPPKVYEPVVYTPSEWATSEHLPKPFDDSQKLMANLGAVAVRETGLDFDGKTADVYRYHSKSEPPLYVVDSDDFFEINWYFASPKDSDKDKAVSVAYAKAVHSIMRQILGDEGTKLMDKLLNQQSATAVRGVAYAHCRTYQCQIVLQKASFR